MRVALWARGCDILINTGTKGKIEIQFEVFVSNSPIGQKKGFSFPWQWNYILWKETDLTKHRLNAILAGAVLKGSLWNDFSRTMSLSEWSWCIYSCNIYSDIYLDLGFMCPLRGEVWNMINEGVSAKVNFVHGQRVMSEKIYALTFPVVVLSS